jgi:hypothetical protein
VDDDQWKILLPFAEKYALAQIAHEKVMLRTRLEGRLEALRLEVEANQARQAYWVKVTEVFGYDDRA